MITETQVTLSDKAKILAEAAKEYALLYHFSYDLTLKQKEVYKKFTEEMKFLSEEQERTIEKMISLDSLLWRIK